MNPDDYADTLEDWLEPTPLPAIDDYHVFARTAFGELIAFGSKNGHIIKVDPMWNAIYAVKNWITVLNTKWDKKISMFFGFAEKSKFDLDDMEDKPLFAPALKRLGPLGPDEMYGFVPALALGGTTKEENLKKMNIFVHLDILSELSDERVMPNWNLS